MNNPDFYRHNPNQQSTQLFYSLPNLNFLYTFSIASPWRSSSGGKAVAQTGINLRRQAENNKATKAAEAKACGWRLYVCAL
jgi:hypothetical protein